MKESKKYQLLIYCLLVFTGSCLEPYNPPAITEPIDILVVDGFVNATNNTASVRLSKATSLAVNDSAPSERNATVKIEEENGNTHSLIEEANGLYTLTNMVLNPSQKYRLIILTSDGEKYFSDYIELQQSPPIDSITWRPTQERDGINIFVNAHGTENMNSRNYLWTFEETWEYTSSYPPFARIENGQVVLLNMNIYRCWTSKPSTEIHIASSLNLNENIIRDNQLVFIPSGSQKVSRRYSILVQQRTLNKEAFDFWTQLKKTTENLGSLFDPLPAQVLGNIHRADDSSQPVLGYFDGASVAEHRLFIDVTDLPDDLLRFRPPVCTIDSIDVNELASYPNLLLVGSYGDQVILGYTTAESLSCMDCRASGGDLKRPDFW